ncbi:MAG: metal-binding protein [Idiomarinaceae bacterium]|nr:metal-binding protein [Idiomarinaceae bacterium]|tara:strand:- start:8913 stop:9281 length:369 start_codon:yes stop_codon:yes gene_type:complete
MKAPCQCKESPELVDLSKEGKELVAEFSELDVGNWVYLMKCPTCGQLWRVDEWDKYQPQYAVKLPTSENWQAFEAIPLIKKKMVENRGGISEQLCMWRNCNEKQVNGSAFCVDHLYETGARS